MDGLSYSDVFLKQSFSRCDTRRLINTRVSIGGYEFNSPAIPANMESVVDIDLSRKWSENGLFYILHRFYDYADILNFVRDGQNKIRPISISIGVKPKDYELLDKIVKNEYYVDFITIDVAHGWHSNVSKILDYINKLKIYHPFFNPFVFAGNVMSGEACRDLVRWGANGVKVGLSMGRSCKTFNATGVGSPMFSTILECRSFLDKRGIIAPIIADGQIREIGDISKALFAGANMVMIGSLFAACSDSPAELINGEKIYFGSSARKKEYSEGYDNLPLKETGTSLELFEKIQQGIQSFLSYRGQNSLGELRYDRNGWGVLKTPRHLYP